MRSDFRERFREFLALRGQELTPQREAIIDVILAMRCDFTAEDLQERMRLMNADRVSRSTLFRTLEFLTKANLLERTIVGEHNYFYFRANY
jgi:Fe2+ or Zn2+ uptake regulation protein